MLIRDISVKDVKSGRIWRVADNRELDMLDWAANGIRLLFPVTGTANAVFLGDSSRSYTANRVALAVRHRF